MYVTSLYSPEEDLGVSKTELLLVQLEDVHNSLSGCLVILSLGYSSSSNDVVASLELGVHDLIGESSPADSDTSQDTIALVLMHNQVRLNTSRLLVSVGHHATNEVRLCLVQGGHKIIQLSLEVGGHSLATLALLPVLVLWSKESRVD